jgi:5-methylcytosine-specific restriction endonuclease McrA
MTDARRKAELLRDLRDLAVELGETPTQSDVNEHFDYTHSVFYTAFGSLNNAKEQLGLALNKENNAPRVTLDCAGPDCTETVAKTEREAEQSEYHYCSEDCLSEHKRERYAGDGNPRSTLEAVACDACGATLQRPRWKREQNEHFFCDYDCMGDWIAETQSGEDSPHWKEFPQLNCQQCGKVFKARPSESDNRRFCGKRCWYQWYSEAVVGEDNPAYNSVSKVCESCGEEYTVKQSEADISRFCSNKCKHKDGHPSGENHPRWNPENTDLYYGANWAEQRVRAIIRDQARCQARGCDTTEGDSIGAYGFGLDVHHRTSLREYRDGDRINYTEANGLENLITLCRRCHNKADAGELCF